MEEKKLEKIELPTKKKNKNKMEEKQFPNVITDFMEEDILKNLSLIATDSNLFTIDCSFSSNDGNILNFLSVSEHLDRNAMKDGVGYNVVIFTEKWSVVYNGVDKNFIETRVVDLMKEFNVSGDIIEDLKKLI